MLWVVHIWPCPASTPLHLTEEYHYPSSFSPRLLSSFCWLVAFFTSSVSLLLTPVNGTPPYFSVLQENDEKLFEIKCEVRTISGQTHFFLLWAYLNLSCCCTFSAVLPGHVCTWLWSCSVCSAAKVHSLLFCALCTVAPGLVGHKEFVSVTTGDVSTHVFDKAGSVKISTLFPPSTERWGWFPVCCLYI